jgi:hypothetical protein
MSERNDKKLRQVPVGSYTYRHEAEFAAGFLESAGIPTRLQIDDPALGLSASEGATLWVLAVDERRARAVLDQEKAFPAAADAEEEWDAPESEDPASTGPPERAVRDNGPGRGGLLRQGAAREVERSDGAARSGAPPGAARSGPSAAVERGSGPGMDFQVNMKPDLTLRERFLAIVGGLGVSSLMGVDAVVRAHPAVPWVIALCAVALVLAGVLGRAPGPVKALLSTLSGDAP